MRSNFDCSGWATKAGKLCSDGRVIGYDAFKHQDGQKVPVVYNHMHNDIMNVLGYAILSHRDGSMWCDVSFNNTPGGLAAKETTSHGDICSFSIYANKLRHNGNEVVHGDIKEVSLVLAGANPGAIIEEVLTHSDRGYLEETEMIYALDGDDNEIIAHSDTEEDNVSEQEETIADQETENTSETENDEELQHAEASDGREDKEEMANDNIGAEIEKWYDNLPEKEQDYVDALVGAAASGLTEDDDKKGDDEMAHSIFDCDTENGVKGSVLSHADQMSIIERGRQLGHFKDALKEYEANNGEILCHAEFGYDGTLEHSAYGVGNMEMLQPEAHIMQLPPEFISREMGWVSTVLNGVQKVPFSKIKTIFADIRGEEARARGYMKGNFKKEEFFTLLQRETSATTIYKKQKFDRDDLAEITGFDFLAWIRHEMDVMLDEEKARAILVGDGRMFDDEDKIKEDKVRPIWTDDDLYTVKKVFEQGDDAAKDAAKFIDTTIRSRKDYKGSGSPALYTTEDVVTECLLLENAIGDKKYKTEAELATALRVTKIITVEVMENLTRKVGAKTRQLLGLIVNLKDYRTGCTPMGQRKLFDGFDLDYNQQKYLLEERFCGCLVRTRSAVAIEMELKAA